MKIINAASAIVDPKGKIISCFLLVTLKISQWIIENKEAKKIIAEFNKPNVDDVKSKTTSLAKNKSKSKKISKK